MGRMEGWGMATGLLRATTPRLPLEQQTSPSPQPPPQRFRLVLVCRHIVTSQHLESGIRRPASWGEAKSDFTKVSLPVQNWVLAVVIYADAPS